MTAPSPLPPDPVGEGMDIVAALIESVASRSPTDVYGLAAVLAGDNTRAMILRALKAHDDMLAALKTCRCPGGGWNGMPADIEPTIENCMAAGACGCDCGDAIRKAKGQTP